MNLDFYHLLYDDQRFCQALGQVMLSASKLESQLRKYLEIQGNPIDHKKATLGKLISELKKDNHLSKNMEAILLDLKLQRNYLSHSIYDLLSNEIQETMLSRDVLPSDVLYYAEKAEQTAENCSYIAELIQEHIQKYYKNGTVLPPIR